MLKKSGFLSAFIIPALVIAGYYGGSWWSLSVFLFVFILIPGADAIIGLDTSNSSPNEKDRISNDQHYRYITYLWVPIQFLFIFWAIWELVTNIQMTNLEFICLVVGTGMVTGGIGITVAHELGHKNTSAEQLMSQVLLLTVCYMHFFIEHNRGHHIHVATNEDPATARKGENFYRFFFRSVVMGWLHAWKIENDSRKRKKLRVWSIQNRMIIYSVLPVIFCALLCGFAKWIEPATSVTSVIIFFLVQSIIGFGLLELVNYVEHYGITRRKLNNGTYERVNPLHSWNTAYLISNLFLFQLQRHSDHHTYASKRYQVLDHSEESPQLPYGYPTMILIALLPPFWFYVMDKKLEQWRKSIPLAA